MEKDFKAIADSLPCGLIITDNQLNIQYMNEFAREKIFSGTRNSIHANMRDQVYYTTDMRLFSMDDCMQNMINQGKRDFHKTLILKSYGDDRLVYFSVKGFTHKSSEFYIFNITDISGEMDCITYSPGTFGKGEFILRKKIIGHDPAIVEIYRMISLAADSEVNVLIQGESGTGKELVADAIHELSDRKNKPLIKVNCAALTETLLESELFGHVKGAFTDAYKDKTGKFEQANGGTIFLDEIAEISQSLQVKLLRVLQEKVIERVGDNKTIKVDMRIVAATNKDLRELIRHNIFREDLFYRLNVFNIKMPPLRERYLDIPLLIDYFVEKYNRTTSRSVKGLSKEAMKALLTYSWPGNIRELQNAIEHAFVLVRSGLIELADLPEEIRKGPKEPVDKKERDLSASVYYAEGFRKNKNRRLTINKEQLMGVLEMNDWNQTKTAEYLGISRVALWKKMKKLGI